MSAKANILIPRIKASMNMLTQIGLVLMTVTQLYAILNPVSVIPTYLSVMEGTRKEQRRRLLNKAILIVFILMMLFLMAGNLILSILKVSVDSVRFGGGILLLVISIDMLSGIPRTKTLEEKEAIFVVPIASPLLVGPGTITTLIVLSASIELYITAISVMIVTFLIYVTLRLSEKITKIIGRNGVRAMGRIMAIIIAATAAEMIHTALANWGIAKA